MQEMINRRNFLALIPSLSAIPLIGKEIIQEPDKVTIIKPEPVKIEQPTISNFDMRDCELAVIHKPTGKVISSGYLTSFQIDHPFYPEFGRSITVEGQMYNFHL
jgi:hypothetical protein